MKKLKFLLLGLLTAALAGGILAACGGTDTYTVTFDTRGGTAVASQTLSAGERVTRPADPSKKMFTFDDWYADAALSEPYTFGKMPAQDITVYAGWLPEESVRVSYDLGYDAPADALIKDDIGVAGGSGFRAPDAPQRKGYTFVGWYVDKDGTGEAFAFNTFPAASMTLYARWEKDSANYAFVTYYGNGKLLGEEVFENNAQWKAPDFFAGRDDLVTTNKWYTNKTMTQEYTSGTLSGELTLYTAFYTKGLQVENGVVTRYDGTAQDVVVPNVYEGKPVTSVAAYAFHEKDIRTADLPASVTTIGDAAFYGCAYLTSVDLTAAEMLGEYAFAGCTRLTDIGSIAELSEIPEGCFMGCAKLAVLSEREELDENWETVRILNELSVEEIGEKAFADCTSLTTLSVEDIQEVGAQAFDGCSALVNIALGGVFEIGANAFAGCTRLAVIGVNTSNRVYSVQGGSLYDKISTTLLRYAAGETAETSFTLPEKCTEVSAYAFEAASALTDVDLSPATKIAAGALVGLNNVERLTLRTLQFDGASFLAAGFGAAEAENMTTGGTHSLYIPATLTSVTLTEATTIADYAFYGASGLETVTAEGLTSIGKQAFAYTAMTAFAVPQTLRSIGAGLFLGTPIAEFTGGSTAVAVKDGMLTQDNTLYAVSCSVTGAFTLPESITAVADYALYGSSITELTVPSAASIGFAAFGNMQQLTALTVPCIGDGARNSYMGYVFGARMSWSATTDEQYAALGVSGVSRLPSRLKTLTITGAERTAVPDMAFALLESLETVILPEGSEIQSYGAFSYYMTKVSQADLSEATTIGDMAFRGTRLTEVRLNATEAVTAGAASFAEIVGLKTIDLGKLTKVPSAMFYAAYTAGEVGEDNNTYILYRSEVTSLTIPATVTEIGQEAFYGLGMAELWVPVSAEQQPGAVTHGTPVAGFTLTFAGNSTLTAIASNAFYGCGVTQLALPASLTSVGAYAFMDCAELQSVTFGTDSASSSLSEVWAYAFTGCKNLEAFTVYSAIPALFGIIADPDTFENGYPGSEEDVAEEKVEDYYLPVFDDAAKVTVYVPAGSVDDYQAAYGWKTLRTIQAIGTTGGEA